MATVGVFKELGLVHHGYTVIVVHSPHILCMVLDEAEVVAAFAGAFVDAQSVQVVRHLLKRAVFVL